LALCACLLAALTIVKAQGRTWSAGLAGNDDQVSALLEMRPDPNARTGYRAELTYFDGIREGTQEAIGAMGGVTYDVIQDAEVPLTFPFGLGTVTIKVTGYVGGLAGVAADIHGKPNYDATAVGLIGIGIGDKKNRASIEYLVPGDKILDWDNLANLDYTNCIRLVFVHRW